MFDQETFNSLHVEKTADDPVVALIAEYYRKEKIARDAQASADDIEFGLPQDVRYQQPKIIVGHLRIDDGELREKYATSEADIVLLFPADNPLWARIQKDSGISFTPRANPSVLIAEMRSEQARIRAAYEASGHGALVERAASLDEEADAVLTEIKETPPVSLAGVEALLELRRFLYEPEDHEILGNVLRWLCATARMRP